MEELSSTDLEELSESDLESTENEETVDDGQSEESETVAVEFVEGESWELPPELASQLLDDSGNLTEIGNKFREHMMRDKDYRQKTQSLAQQRKDLERIMADTKDNAADLARQRKELEPLIAIDNMAKQNSQFKTAMNQVIGEYFQGVNYDPRSNEPVHDERVDAMIAQVAKTTFTSKWDTLVKAYPSLNNDVSFNKLVDYLENKNVLTSVDLASEIDAAAKVLFFNEMMKEASKKNAKTAAKTFKARKSAQGIKRSGGIKPPEKRKSLADIVREMDESDNPDAEAEKIFAKLGG